MILASCILLAAVILLAGVAREKWEREDRERGWSVDVQVRVQDDEGH